MSKHTTALILGDLQNDFMHPDGAYGRARQSAADIAALPARLAPLVKRRARARHPHRRDLVHAGARAAAASRSSRRTSSSCGRS